MHLQYKAQRKYLMCYTCGCKLPYEDHGDEANLVESDLEEAGETEAIGQAGKLTAKEKLMELLQLQKDQGELEDPRDDYN